MDAFNSRITSQMDARAAVAIRLSGGVLSAAFQAQAPSQTGVTNDVFTTAPTRTPSPRIVVEIELLT